MSIKRNKRVARRKNPSFFYSLFLVSVAIGVIMLIVYAGLSYLLNNNLNFRVREIRLVMPNELKVKFGKFNSYLGTPIFSVNLNEISGYSPKKYPYLEYLRAIRRLPNCIEIEAKPRRPIARTQDGLLIDTKGVVFPDVFNRDYSNLPLIGGINSLEQGRQVKAKELYIAFEIIRKNNLSVVTKSLAIDSIYAGNSNDISFIYSSGPEVKIGCQDLDKKFFILAKIITDTKNELSRIKYIDLRFKSPVIGYK